MASALIVTSTEKSNVVLREVLTYMQISAVQSITTGNECRRHLMEHDYDVMLINTPLSDEFGHALAVYAAESTQTGVVLLVKNELADEIGAKVEDAGVFVVARPIHKALLCGGIKLALAARRRLTKLQTTNTLLQQKIEDIRLIDRAKCALIQYKQFTEPEAHKYIEKEAMDSRISRRQAAQRVLQMYEGYHGTV